MVRSIKKRRTTLYIFDEMTPRRMLEEMLRLESKEAALILAHGIEFTQWLKPHSPSGIPRQCYRNAALAAIEDPERLRYCEGYATHPALCFPIHHAWACTVGPNPLLYDPTWGSVPAPIYFGVAFRHRWLTAHLLRESEYGVFPHPSVCRRLYGYKTYTRVFHPLQKLCATP